MIGYADVKTSPVYFYVQKNVSHTVHNSKIPFELTRLNIGGAMNLSSGTFIAPRNGIYTFHFSSLSRHPTSSSSCYVIIYLMLNGIRIGSSDTHISNSNNSYYSQSLHSTLELKVGDEVWLLYTSTSSGPYLHDNENYHTHFTGYLLHENVASSLNLAGKVS